MVDVIYANIIVINRYVDVTYKDVDVIYNCPHLPLTSYNTHCRHI